MCSTHITGPRFILLFLVTILSGCGGGSGFNDAPSIQNQAISTLTPKSVTLGAIVNPNGVETTVLFEWGTTANFGNSTGESSVGSGLEGIAVSYYLDGVLLPDTTYHYRTIARSRLDTVIGDAYSFDTPPVPLPTVITVAGTVTPATVANAGCDMRGAVNPNGFTTSGWFEWGVDTAYGNATPEHNLGSGIGNVGLIDSIDAVALPDTSYHYRAVARNEGGIAYGEDAECTTPAGIIESVSPIVTTESPNSPATSTSASLPGTVIPNDYDAYVRFEWGLDIGYGNQTTESVQPFISGQSVNFFNSVITGLAPDTIYHYRSVVRGVKQGAPDVIKYGEDRQFTTDTADPPLVTTMPPSNISANSCTLNGAVNPNGFATDAWFEWGTDTSYGGGETLHVQRGNGTMDILVDSPLANLIEATTYHYRIVAMSAGGIVFGQDMTCQTPLSFRIENLSVQNMGATNATITWTTTKPASSRVNYGATSNYGFSVQDNTLKTGHSLALSGLSPSTPYHFNVVSADSANNTISSGDTVFTTANAPLTTINVAQGKTGIASSTYTGYNVNAPLDGSLAQSGDTMLTWAPGNANPGEWYMVDLEAVYTIDQVVLYMGKNNAANSYPQSFNIETSEDGATWSTQKTVVTNDQFVRTFTFMPVDARYVKISLLNGSALDGLSYIVEFEVYEAVFASSGSYTSAIFNTGQNSNFTTVDWIDNTDPLTQDTTVKVRTCDDPVCEGEQDFNVLASITNGDFISTGGGAMDGHRYVQYQVMFSTTDPSYTPSLEEININYDSGSWSQTNDGDTVTVTSFNLSGSSHQHTQISDNNGGNIQLAKPPLGGTGQDGGYVCLSVCNDLAGGVYNFTSFHIADGAVVDVPAGVDSLIIYSQGNVTIDGLLKANGSDGKNGDPGICSTCAKGGEGGIGGTGGKSGGAGGGTAYTYPAPGANGQGTGRGIGGKKKDLFTCDGAGGGGGFGGTGGNGVVSVGGTGGSVYGIPMNGGSGGGGGCGITGGGGGGSGGTVRISTAGIIFIGENGLVQTNGGDGGFQIYSNQAYVNDSGGGGSGGGIQLEAVTVTNDGIIEANGGHGRTNGTYGSGGGGGGRIAIYDIDGNIDGTGAISAIGGNGVNTGQDGVQSIIINTNYSSPAN